MQNKENGFTLVEVILAIFIIGLAYSYLMPRLPSMQYYREEAMLRKLSETIIFLHQQAINDDVFYRIEFDLNGSLGECKGTPCYRIGQIVPEGSSGEEISTNSSSGLLSGELSSYLMPNIGESQYLTEPVNFPSLKKPVLLESDTYINDIRTIRGDFQVGDSERPYITFSPRGFTEFSVIHLQLSNDDNKVTILVNPFTGLTEIYRDTKFLEFEWTYNNAG